MTTDKEPNTPGFIENEPIANADMRLGPKLAVSYDNIRDHGSF